MWRPLNPQNNPPKCNDSYFDGAPQRAHYTRNGRNMNQCENASYLMLQGTKNEF
jgi:hypothetical protein